MSSKHMPTRRGGAAQGFVFVQFEKKQHSKSVLLLAQLLCAVPCMSICMGVALTHIQQKSICQQVIHLVLQTCRSLAFSLFFLSSSSLPLLPFLPKSKFLVLAGFLRLVRQRLKMQPLCSDLGVARKNNQLNAVSGHLLEY